MQALISFFMLIGLQRQALESIFIMGQPPAYKKEKVKVKVKGNEKGTEGFSLIPPSPFLSTLFSTEPLDVADSSRHRIKHFLQHVS